MKKFFMTLLIGAVALMAMSCETGNEGGTKDGQLATPDVGINIQGNTIIAAWDAVEFAAYYDVQLNAGEVTRTDELSMVFSDLVYGETYTVSVTAISADQTLYTDSETSVSEVTLPERVAPQYREWYPTNGVAGSAISNNGRYVVGAYDRNGFMLDLNTDILTEVQGVELYDVADNGVAIGSSHRNNPDGLPAIYIDGTVIELDLSDITEQLSMGAFTGITPDGEYAVGWAWDTASTYYTQMCGELFPICYNLITERISVPEIASTPYFSMLAGIAPKAVAPDRSILGYEQSLDIFSILWSAESSAYEYVHLNYDDEYNPTESMGDTQNLFSPSGRYIFGKGKTYSAEGYPTEYPAAYDRETGEMMWFDGGSVTAMADNGIAFINDAPYYIGTTSYIVDTASGDYETQTPIVDWLAVEHGIGLGKYIPDGIIVIGTSTDCNTILGITNTEMGWLTCVISLNGAPMTE